MTQFVLAIIISIAVLVFLIVKLNVHPVISLFVGGMLCGSILGNSPLVTITTIANGFGSTLGSIGMTIIFGSIIACSIRDSGAAKSMVNFFISLFRGKNLELSRRAELAGGAGAESQPPADLLLNRPGSAGFPIAR